MAFDNATAAQVLERVAQGMSLREVAADLDLGSHTNILHACIADRAFADQYARAKELAAEVLADEIIEIAEDNRNDWVKRENKRTGETYVALNSEAIERSKMRIEARKWTAAKLLPKKYGDRSALELTGANGSDLFAGLGKAELLAELARRMSTPEIARALAGTLPALAGTATKPDPAK